MPDAQRPQIAAMTDEAVQKEFKADDHRVAYLEWLDRMGEFLKNVVK